MTDDIVQRIRAEADIASRAGQSAALHKIADDLAALAAAGAGEAVDREALGSHILATLPDAVWQEGSDVIAMHAADAVLAFLAARGDAATPTVTAEQVRQSLALAGEHGRYAWFVRRLAALGIEVEGGEGA
ncbi:hypothetical protein [Cellulomonas sp. C5510]|uniref:hypothetical protein n=1 Tax=Cellulomonas sp. C5510 TaxID=2871170 RepID=UPI001C93AB65|nr:hypothetical protein [Cellulomonas sp. C5510]QZN86914.1 hypothetical protein K5O09_07325 [Cellulomonas sp. C5510]